MHENDILNVKIEKFSNLGTGIAKVDGQVVFVENSCPEDEVKIKITKVNKNYATAKTLEVIAPSKHRIEPFCPMQKICGACQLQFIDYDYQLKLKKQIVEDAMRTIGHINTPINDPIPSPKIKAYRCKVQYPVAQTKVSERILAGYYKPQSHELVNIKYCPIQPQICDKIIDFIRNNAKNFNITGYNEKKHSGDLKHIVIRVSEYTEKCLLTLVLNSKKSFKNAKDFATYIFESFDEISGVCFNYNDKKTNVILSSKTELICGKDFVEEKIIDKVFKIGANTFFQVNPKSAENIFKYVKEYIQNNYKSPIVLDAYAGVSSFGICISDVCQKVVSVEENEYSTNLAKEIIKINSINNIEINNMDAGKFFQKETRKFDAIILDPPRKGCSKESLDNALKLSKGKIIYVSCNPVTLARDLKYLTEQGCIVESIQPFDMFCHTFHIENVAIIST